MSHVQESASGDVMWRQYALHVDLYKFYLDLSIKVNVFYYAITGAILTYYFQHSADRFTRYSLLLPIAFSLAIGALFLYGAALLKTVREDLIDLRDALHLDTAPDVQVLVVFLRAFGVIIAATGVCLAALFLLTRA